MKGTVCLTTERLLLRKYRIADAKVLFCYFGCDEKIYEFSGWNPYATEEMAENTVRQFIDNYADKRFYGWAIERKSTLIGTLGAYDYDPGTNSIELGISIKRACWGKGYATEAIRCVLEYLTETEKIDIVKAWCALGNAGSKSVIEKSGMAIVSVEPEGLEIGGSRFDKLNYEYIRT